MKRAAIAAAAALCACGYGFSQRYAAAGGIDRIHVRPFENRSTETDLGAAVTTALRSELSRRGADADEGNAAVLEGEVRATEPALTSTTALGATAALTSTAGATWRIGIEVRARLRAGDGKPIERTIRRDTDYLGGADPLETEGRRALALRRVADEAARELLRSLER